MNFKGKFLVLVALFTFVNVGQAKAVGEQVCNSVSGIASQLPNLTSYIDGMEIKCSFSGCKTYYKCKSLDLAEQLEFTLTMLCDALAQYAPGSFPDTPFTMLNGELLNISNSLTSMATPLGANSLISDAALSADFLDLENSITNIESMIPIGSEEPEERWVRKKRYCKTDSLGDYEDEDDEEDTEEQPEDEACSQGVSDLDADVADIEGCLAEDGSEDLETAAQADYNTQLQAETDLACPDSAAADYDDCVALVEESFVYIPSGDVADVVDTSVDDALAEAGLTQEELDAIADGDQDIDTSEAGQCIPSDITLPEGVTLPEDAYCPEGE